MLKINMKYRKGKLIVEIIGDLTKENANYLNEYLSAVILKHNIQKIVYDTKKLLTLDSYGLKVLKRGVYAVKSNSGYVYYSKNSKILKIIEG